MNRAIGIGLVAVGMMLMFLSMTYASAAVHLQITELAVIEESGADLSHANALEFALSSAVAFTGSASCFYGATRFMRFL